MCGRFTLTSSQEQISAVLPGLVFARAPEPRYNIAPTQPIAVVLNDGQGRVTHLRWGLVPSWAKDPAIGNRMINARSETIHEKPSFKGPFRRRRCLVLADGFYEWKKVPGQKTKIPTYIRLRNHRPFAFAGLWDRWLAPSGEEVVSGTIITTQPNALLASIHNRMPVILAPAACEAWIDPTEQPPDRLLPLLTPFPAEEMEFHAVSRRVNVPSVDEPACIEPAPDAEPDLIDKAAVRADRRPAPVLASPMQGRVLFSVRAGRGTSPYSN